MSDLQFCDLDFRASRAPPPPIIRWEAWGREAPPVYMTVTIFVGRAGHIGTWCCWRMDVNMASGRIDKAMEGPADEPLFRGCSIYNVPGNVLDLARSIGCPYTGGLAPPR